MSDIVACMRFSDGAAQLAFLERTLGFTPTLVEQGEHGLAHAELQLGSGFVMAHEGEDEWAYRTPRELGGKSTGMIYVAHAGIDAAYAQARAAGATIVRELAGTEYGSREFAVRDPEGFGWSFGTYHPTVDGMAQPGTPPAVFAGLRYVDAGAAIAWLVRAFGFEAQYVVPGEGEQIAHAQLRFGADLLMLGSTRADEFDTTTPALAGGFYTHSYYLHVADPDAHCARAEAAGAQILSAPAERPYGARDYVARDPEGYVWTCGTYRPAAQPAQAAAG